MKEVRILGTLEARMGSSRLPGKTLKQIQGDLTLLELAYKRFCLCREVDKVCVATSTSPLDDKIAEYCETKGIPFFRGSEQDVLLRVVSAAQVYKPEAIVQMGADSGYLDFKLIDRLVRIYKNNSNYDYVCNDLIREYPLGIYGHIVKFRALQEVNSKTDLSQQEREDVVRPLWNRSQHYKLLNVKVSPEYHYPELRLTIDYEEDFNLLQNVLTGLGKWDYTFQEVLELKKRNPSIFESVSKLIQKSATSLTGINFETCELSG